MDWESKVIRIFQSKNGDGRILPLIDELYTLVQRRWGVKNGDFIFHRDGHPIKHMQRAWNTACQKAGLDGRLFHDCRRSAVRNAIESGLSERHTMALCGHRTNHMLYRYHIVVEHDLRQAMLKTVANTSIRPKNVSDADTDERQPPQPIDFVLRRRIGAGVPPGLQIQ